MIFISSKSSIQTAIYVRENTNHPSDKIWAQSKNKILINPFSNIIKKHIQISQNFLRWMLKVFDKSAHRKSRTTLKNFIKNLNNFLLTHITNIINEIVEFKN